MTWLTLALRLNCYLCNLINVSVTWGVTAAAADWPAWSWHRPHNNTENWITLLQHHIRRGHHESLRPADANRTNPSSRPPELRQKSRSAAPKPTTPRAEPAPRAEPTPILAAPWPPVPITAVPQPVALSPVKPHRFAHRWWPPWKGRWGTWEGGEVRDGAGEWFRIGGGRREEIERENGSFFPVIDGSHG
jgi:hypothetical protein